MNDVMKLHAKIYCQAQYPCTVYIVTTGKRYKCPVEDMDYTVMIVTQTCFGAET